MDEKSPIRQALIEFYMRYFGDLIGEAAGERLGVSQQTASLLKRGEVSLFRHLENVARATGKTPGVVLLEIATLLLEIERREPPRPSPALAEESARKPPQ